MCEKKKNVPNFSMSHASIFSISSLTHSAHPCAIHILPLCAFHSRVRCRIGSSLAFFLLLPTTGLSLSSFWQVQVPNTKTQFQRFRAVKWVVQIRFVPIFSFNPLYNSKCFCSFVFFLSLRSRCLKYIYIYVYNHSLFQGFGQEFFFVSAQVCNSRNWNSRSNSFVRAPALGGGSNAPRPAVSVPHIDVNADGCRARQARSCKNAACRGGFPEVFVVS